MRHAAFPTHKTLEDFDFTARPAAEKPLILHLAQTEPRRLSARQRAVLDLRDRSPPGSMLVPTMHGAGGRRRGDSER